MITTPKITVVITQPTNIPSKNYEEVVKPKKENKGNVFSWQRKLGLKWRLIEIIILALE